MDNEKYLRYSGEIQVVRETLKADERVNVIGWMQMEYQEILKNLERSRKIVFIKY